MRRQMQETPAMQAEEPAIIKGNDLVKRFSAVIAGSEEEKAELRGNDLLDCFCF